MLSYALSSVVCTNHKHVNLTLSEESMIQNTVSCDLVIKLCD